MDFFGVYAVFFVYTRGILELYSVLYSSPVSTGVSRGAKVFIPSPTNARVPSYTVDRGDPAILEAAIFPPILKPIAVGTSGPSPGAVS